MRPLIFALALTAAFVGGAETGRANNLDRSTEGQDVTVAFTSPFADLPPGGCVPYRVNIRNDRNAAGTWHLAFQGITFPSSLGATVYEQEVSVPPNSSGSFDLLVPLPLASAERGSTNLELGVSGPGFSGSGMNGRFFTNIFANNTGSRSPFTIIGSGVLGSIGLGPLESVYKDQGKEFYGGEVDPASLPSDWRGYSGVAAVILRDSEWLSLTSAQREAVGDYVAQGGRLTLFTSEDLETKTPELQLPGRDGKPGPYGFGIIFLESAAAFPPNGASLYTIVERNPALSARDVDQRFSTWGLRHLAGTVTVSSAFIFSFVVLFGTLIGPVNLFVFTRGDKRFRLFWTTPLISILASLALMAGILLTDGLGGHGKQMIAVFSLPGVHREAVIQEQVARTAVLFSTAWRNDQKYLITPVSADALNDAKVPIGAGMYGSRRRLGESPNTFRQKGDEFSGHWFRSRAVSGQYLQAMRPSRSQLAVLNPAALEEGQAPVVLSSFPQELTRVFLVDSHRNYWICENLQPGRKQTCAPSTPGDCDEFWNNACADAGGKLAPLLLAARGRPGCFYAAGPPAESDTLATLGEIRWEVASGVCLGPWVASPASENGP